MWDSGVGPGTVPHLEGTRGPPNLTEVFGAGNRTRTGDFDLGKVALYQLSYSRVIIV